MGFFLLDSAGPVSVPIFSTLSIRRLQKPRQARFGRWMDPRKTPTFLVIPTLVAFDAHP
jgi:hypothetical protein